MNEEISSLNVLNAIQHGGEPIKSYRKTILGKLFVHVWNSFTDSPEGILLTGEPTKEEAIFDVFNEKEKAYFEAKNKRLMVTGNLISHVRAVEKVKKEKRIEEYSDEELKKVLKQKFFALRSLLDKIDTEPVLFRLIALAEDMNKSSKTVEAIKSKLSEVQIDSIPGNTIGVEE